MVVTNVTSAWCASSSLACVLIADVTSLSRAIVLATSASAKGFVRSSVVIVALVAFLVVRHRAGAAKQGVK